MKYYHSCIVLLMAIFLLSDFSTIPAWSNKIKPLNLKSLVKSAGGIFEGECIEINSGKDPESGLMATWYTFRVREGIKGKLNDEFTLKQYGGTDGTINVHVPSVAHQVGEKVILFVYGKSKIGFSSCVGMNQGKFNVKEIPETGAKYVTNGMPAMLLFEDMPRIVPTLNEKGEKASGHQRLSSKLMSRKAFVDEIKHLIKEEKKEKK